MHRRWVVDEGLVARALRRVDAVGSRTRVEQQTVKTFEDALGGMLPPTVRDLVEAQYVQAQAGRDRVRALMTI